MGEGAYLKDFRKISDVLVSGPASETSHLRLHREEANGAIPSCGLINLVLQPDFKKYTMNHKSWSVLDEEIIFLNQQFITMDGARYSDFHPPVYIRRNLPCGITGAVEALYYQQFSTSIALHRLPACEFTLPIESYGLEIIPPAFDF